MPEEVRREISPWFTEMRAVQGEALEKIEKLDDNANSVEAHRPSFCVAKMERLGHEPPCQQRKTIPDEFTEDHQLSSIVLEYRRECDSSDTVQSICEPDEDSLPRDKNIRILTGFRWHRRFSTAAGCLGRSTNGRQGIRICCRSKGRRRPKK
ncbi:hypothetical protein BHE74_00013330 [Ensete ventricosum]|nr:hypothetical protein BHE74_00013330 [Ensete ventricosum]